MIRNILAGLLLAPQAGSLAQPRQVGPELNAARGVAVLRIDGEEISSEEYARWLLDNFGARMATTFAGDHLVEKEARRRGVQLSPEEVAAELERELGIRIAGAFLGSKDAWLAELARTQRSEAGVRAQRTKELEVELWTRKAVAVDRIVPEVKIVREWELSYGRGGRAYDLSMLLVRCEFLTLEQEVSKEEKDRLRQEEIDVKRLRALELRERIVRGADFAAIAREASDDEASRSGGGKPRDGFRHYGWPSSFLDALDQLAQGEVSQPIYAKGGWWIVRVDGLRATALEGVRAELVARLEARGPEQDETGAFRNALVEAAQVEVLPTLYVDSSVDVEAAALMPGLAIDGKPVSRGAYARWIQRTRGEASWPAFVEQRVVINEARRRGVEVSEADVRARSEEFVQRLVTIEHQGSREAWVAQVKLKGGEERLFLHDLDLRMRIELLCERLMLLAQKVTPEQVRARFEELYGKDGKSVKVRMILLNVPLSQGPADETREQMEARFAADKRAVRDRATALARTVREGGDFASLARQNSEDAHSAARGGALDSRFRPELWPDSIGRAVAALGIGEVTDALEFGASFVVLQVLSRENVSFEMLKDELAQQMRSQPPPRAELSVYRNVLMKRARIEVLEGMNR